MAMKKSSYENTQKKKERARTEATEGGQLGADLSTETL